MRDSKVMDGNQSSPDLLLIVRNLQAAGGGRRKEKEKGKMDISQEDRR